MNGGSDQNPSSVTERIGWGANTSCEQQEALKAYLQNSLAIPLIRDVAARTMEVLQLAPGHAVVDVGCGTGVLLPMLARAVGPAGNVVGVDHSPGMVRDAQAAIDEARLAKTVRVRTGSAYALPLPDRAFDAAHCERVLMHLDDPDLAIAEMARVVRPGGRVVAAEPDWAGFRIDHPDRADFDRLYLSSLPHRHPDMGLTLVRRFVQAGLSDVRPHAVFSVMTTSKWLKMGGLNLTRGADLLAAHGVLSRERSQSLISTLEDMDASGRYLAACVFHVTSGVVPEA